MQKKHLVYSYSFIYAVRNTMAQKSIIPPQSYEFSVDEFFWSEDFSGLARISIPSFAEREKPTSEPEVIDVGDTSPCVKPRQRKNPHTPPPRFEAGPRKSATEVSLLSHTTSETVKPTSHKASGTGRRAARAAFMATEFAQQAEETAKRVEEGWHTAKTVVTISDVSGRAGARPTKEAEEKARAKARGARIDE